MVRLSTTAAASGGTCATFTGSVMPVLRTAPCPRVSASRVGASLAESGQAVEYGQELVVIELAESGGGSGRTAGEA